MIVRMLAVLIAVAVGVVLGAAFPGASKLVRLVGLGVPTPSGETKGHTHGHGKHEPEGVVKMSAAQVEAAKIELQKVGGGVLARRISAPGTITADADRVVRVPAKVAG